MLVEFAQFVAQLFPSITTDAAKRLIEEAGRTGLTEEQFFATQLGDVLCQGDIVDGLVWAVEGEDGKFRRPTAPGMLLSHSCDIDNDDWITFAPCAPFDGNLPNAAQIKRNKVTDVYYVPAHQGRKPIVVDLAQVQAMRSARVLKGIADGTLIRCDSLTTLGYYHFILKLTIHFLRPQSADERRYDCTPSLRERVSYAANATLGLARYALLGPVPSAAERKQRK